MHGAADATGVIVGKVAEAVDRAAISGNGLETIDPQAVIIAELETAQAVRLISAIAMGTARGT